MPTYIYSPSKKNNQSARSNASSSNYKKMPQRSPTPRHTPQNVNFLKNVRSNNTKTLRYKTTAPSFVDKRYIQQSNLFKNSALKKLKI